MSSYAQDEVIACLHNCGQTFRRDGLSRHLRTCKVMKQKKAVEAERAKTFWQASGFTSSREAPAAAVPDSEEETLDCEEDDLVPDPEGLETETTANALGGAWRIECEARLPPTVPRAHFPQVCKSIHYVDSRDSCPVVLGKYCETDRHMMEDESRLPFLEF